MTIGGSMINFPGKSIAAALQAEMRGYALMAEISEDAVNLDVPPCPKGGGS